MLKAGVDWRKEFRGVFKFYRKNLAFMAAGVLAMSVIAVHVYFTEEGVPLGVMSSDVIAGLPALFVLLLLGMFSTVFLLIVPIGSLLIESKVCGGSSVASIVAGHTAAEKKESRFRIAFLSAWSAVNLISALYFLGIISLGKLYPQAWSITFVLVYLPVFMLLQVLVISQVSVDAWLVRTREGWWMIFSSSFAQLLILMIVGLVLGRKFDDELLLALAYCGVVLLISIAQASAAIAWVDANEKKGVLVRVNYIVGVLAFLVCIYPPLNGVFVGYVLGAGSLGGKGCVILTWREGSKIINELQRRGVGPDSVELRIPASTTYYYYARVVAKGESSEIYSIQRSDVAKLSACAHD